MLKYKLGKWCLNLLLLLTAGIFLSAFAQSEPQEKSREDRPSEGFEDTLKRMRIKREEEEHQKLVKSAHQAAEIAETLNTLSNHGKLEKNAEKKLREIEKAGKQIRNNVGSNDDEKDFDPPKDLDDGIKRLTETTKLLSEQMDKSSRHLFSAAIIGSANEVLRLVKFLRGFIE